MKQVRSFKPGDIEYGAAVEINPERVTPQQARAIVRKNFDRSAEQIPVLAGHVPRIQRQDRGDSPMHMWNWYLCLRPE